MRYNKGLAIAGVSAFIAYCIIGSAFVPQFEVNGLFTIIQGFGYLIMMGIANVLYGMGQLIDVTFNTTGSEIFRKRLFHLGFWFSVSLPFAIPILVFIKFGIKG